MHTTIDGSHVAPKISLGRKAVLWSLFFLICLGLGYPTLNRYDPRTVTGLYDTRAYYAMVTGDQLQSDQTDLAHRVIVPFAARPIYGLVNGHLHTWNPVFFALLVVNSFFIATTALLLVLVSLEIAGNYPVALVAAFIYLTNFAVANFNLSGYVDSAVNCMIMAIAWTLVAERWWLLPLWGILGALAKETFVPLSTFFAFAWWLAACRRGSLKLAHLAWIGAMATVGLGTVTLLMLRGSEPYTPIGFALSRWQQSGAGHLYFSGFMRCIFAREFLFVFGWLLPLSLPRMKRLPKTWVVATACASLLALAMGAYDDALGNATRAVFSVCGPLLSLSASLLLLDWSQSRSSIAKPPQ
jgi:uncharacterized membrane protein